MSKTRAQQASQRSMETVMAKDRDGWINNFADDGCVQDPVGKSPLDPVGNGHQGKEAIGRFWDMIIAPGKVEFDIRESWPSGDDAVANVGSIFNTMPDGTKIEAKGVFVYHTNEAGKVTNLRAYWDFNSTMMSAKKS